MSRQDLAEVWTSAGGSQGLGRVFLVILMVLAALSIFPVESLHRNAEFLRLLRLEQDMANTGLACTDATLDWPSFAVKYAQLFAAIVNKRYEFALKSLLNSELDGGRRDMVAWKLGFDLLQDREVELASQALGEVRTAGSLLDERLAELANRSTGKGEFESAAAYWKVRVLLSPSEWYGYEILGSFYQGRLNDSKSAIAVFESGSRSVSVGWEASYLAGRAATVRGDWSQAAHYYRVAIGQGTRSGFCYSHLALALRELKDIAGAIAVCKESTRIIPGFYACYTLLGDIYVRVEGDTQSAIYWLEMGLQNVTDDPLRSIVYERLGSIYLAGGDLRKAAAYFERAIELDSINAKAIQGLSATLASMDDVERSLESKE